MLCCRKWWMQTASGSVRLIVFWTTVSLTAAVASLLFLSEPQDPQKFAWDDFQTILKLDSTEVTRCFLAGTVVLLDMLVIFQDWDYPFFTHAPGAKMPGLTVGNAVWRWCCGCGSPSKKPSATDLAVRETLLKKEPVKDGSVKEIDGISAMTRTAEEMEEAEEAAARAPCDVVWTYKWAFYGWMLLVLCLDLNNFRNSVEVFHGGEQELHCLGGALVDAGVQGGRNVDAERIFLKRDGSIPTPLEDVTCTKPDVNA